MSQQIELLRQQLLEKHQVTAPKSWKEPRLQQELESLSVKQKEPLLEKPLVAAPLVEKPLVEAPILAKQEEPLLEKPLVEGPVLAKQEEPLLESPLAEESFEKFITDEVVIEAKIDFTPMSRNISAKKKGEKFIVSKKDAEFFVKTDRTCKYVK